MAIDMQQIGGLQEQALMLRARRHEVLATNIANADTPGYRARDIDFQAALRQATEAAASGTPESAAVNEPALLYRNPWQRSQDGNSVEMQVEQAALADNAVHYQATLNFLAGSFSGLKLAITGTGR